MKKLALLSTIIIYPSLFANTLESYKGEYRLLYGSTCYEAANIKYDKGTDSLFLSRGFDAKKITLGEQVSETIKYSSRMDGNKINYLETKYKKVAGLNLIKVEEIKITIEQTKEADLKIDTVIRDQVGAYDHSCVYERVLLD